MLQIASGGFHTLVLTANNQIYGFGKLTKGQFASKWTKGQTKYASQPTLVNLPSGIELSKVYAGSLFSVLEVTHPNQPAEADANAEEGGADVGGDVGGDAVGAEEAKEEVTGEQNADQQMDEVQ